MALVSRNENRIKVVQPSLPKGGGDVKGLGESFSPHEFSGAMGMTIPLAVTPCRGFEPSLQLNYSSGNGNGPFGLGWELSLPEISRQTSKGIPQYNESDTFLLSGNDYLVPVLDQSGNVVQMVQTLQSIQYTIEYFQPRTAHNFDLIERYTNLNDPSDVFWLVTDDENISSIFGRTARARIVDPNNNARIFKWLLEEKFDAKGNHQIVEYVKENNTNASDKQKQHHDSLAQYYPDKIKYGNDSPVAGSILLQAIDPNTIVWHFEIVFDYGQYILPPASDNPYLELNDTGWLYREDPFSEYSAGFNIRTHRLCRNVLVFHRFPAKEYGSADPVLRKALSLEYDESPVFSLLTSCTRSGFIFNSASHSYDIKSMPSFILEYSRFQPASAGYIQHDFGTFAINGQQRLTGLSESPDFQLTDLFGAGVPGILYNDGETNHYQKTIVVAEDKVSYSTGEPVSFPLLSSGNKTQHTLSDITGNGHLDLMVSHNGEKGFYEYEGKKWQQWKSFENFPTTFHEANYQYVDTTGNGLTDLLIMTNDSIQLYPSLGEKGFGEPTLIEKPGELPPSMADDSQSIFLFMHICGSGLQQLVRIRNGEIVCWPNLGYGHFGEKLTMQNVPYFGDEFDTSRIRFADINCSGLSDLVYIHSTHIEIYLNESGNGFAVTPVIIDLPTKWNTLDQLQFADVLGSGSDCLVFTSNDTVPQQWFYDFNRTEWSDPTVTNMILSLKPYLLTGTDNNMGATVKVRYASSTKFYLQDQALGNEWLSALPFPVQVVEAIIHTDQVSDTFTSISFTYHHGYYDGIERQFQGFGRVEKTDTAQFPGFTGKAESNAYFTPARLTKTWYHTGAFINNAELTGLYRNEYWSGDIDRPVIENTKWLFPDVQTLFGELIAGGVLSNASDGHATIASIPPADQLPVDIVFYPYRENLEAWLLQKAKGTTITLTDLATKLNLPSGNDATVFREACLAMHGSILHNEVYGLDNTYWQDIPYVVTESQFLVRQVQRRGINKYGVFFVQQLQQFSLDYERNPSDPMVTHTLVLKSDEYGNILKCATINYARRPGQMPDTLPAPTKDQQAAINILLTEIFMINKGTPEDAFHIIGLRQEYKESLLTGITPSALYFTMAEFSTKLSAATSELLVWERDYFYDAGIQAELPLGSVTEQLLYHRTEFIEFDQQQLFIGFKEIQTAAELTILLETQGGYVQMPATDPGYPASANYFWNPGSSQSYNGAAAFYLPQHFYNAFQYASLSAIPAATYKYDTYFTLVKEVVDPLGNAITYTIIDYQHMLPAEMQDINKNFSGTLLDPLGMVIVSTFYGSENGTVTGFAPISTYVFTPPVSLQDVVETSPLKYLQSAATYYYYDLFAWEKNKLPLCIAELVAEQYPDEQGIQGSIQTIVAYIDGFGRNLQTKQFLDCKETVRYWDPLTEKVCTSQADNCWVTTGAARYDCKGQPIKNYDPFFSPDYLYINEDPLNEVGFSSTHYYDAIDRLVLTVSPEGFLTKSLNGYWNTLPRLLFSDYLNIKLYGGLPNEFVPCAWQTLEFDQNDTIGDSDYQPEAGSDVDANSMEEAAGCFNTPIAYHKNALNKVIQYSQINVPELEANTTCTLLNILGWEMKATDMRILSIGQWNFVMQRSLSGCEIKTISGDSGTTWNLYNVEDNSFWQQDLQGTIVHRSMDILQRITSVNVLNSGTKLNSQKLNQSVRLFFYGDSQDSTGTPYFQHPEKRNLRGKLFFSFDESGLNLNPFIGILGQSEAVGKILALDYKNEVNWNSISDDTVRAIGNVLANITLPGDLHTLDPQHFSISSLDPVLYTSLMEHDALGRDTKAFDPDGNITVTSYYRTGWIRSLQTTSGIVAEQAGKKAKVGATPSIDLFLYNEKAQQKSIVYGNGVTTVQNYDPKNFRLVSINSTRNNGRTVLQDISYHHDPAGNVTLATDHSIPDIFFKNQQVTAQNTYTYDRLYRLITATGREHTGMFQNLHLHQNNIRLLAGLPTTSNPVSNGKALQNYTHVFTYDVGSNLVQIKSSARGGSFTRSMTIDNSSNRLSNSSTGMILTSYEYDNNGGQLNLDGLNHIQWNYRNNIQRVAIIPREQDEASDAEYYVYDAAGHRCRKVRETTTGAGINIVETIYLGSFEIRRKGKRSSSNSFAIAREWHWNNIADCRWGYIVSGTPKNGVQGYQLRYQLRDKLKSSTTELDETGHIISYEEYYPYGGTSIIAATVEAEVKQRYYRYSGKEEDDASGLYYYGMRYYCPWLGRWMSADPAGTINGLNLYAFVTANPETDMDENGLSKGTIRQAAKDATLKIALTAKKESTKKQKNFGWKGRAVIPKNGSPTQPVNDAAIAASMNYKVGTTRFHWKGTRDPANTTLTTGIGIFVTERDPKAWTVKQKATRRILKDFLDNKISPAEFAPHLAELSHTLAGSLHGPNDALNAFAASTHQNTEWLAMETAVKEYKDANPGVDVRIKLTSYVHEAGQLKGTLKASRFKIFLNGRKAFDRRTLGVRDVIDRNEAKAVYDAVKGMKTTTHLPQKNAVSPLNPPDETEMRKGTQSSLRSPAFSSLQQSNKPNQIFTGQAAAKRVP